MARKKVRLDCDGKPIVLTDEQRMGVSVQGVRKWKAPIDMPDKIVKLVLAGKICGGKLAKNTGYCKSKAIVINGTRPPPYRCSKHGGNNLAQKNGVQVNLSHGIYTDAMHSHELDFYEHLSLDTVDEEIKITKMRLRRALQAQRIREANSEADGGTPNLSVSEEEQILIRGRWVTVKRKVDDNAGYGQVINMLVNQLTKLHRTRMDLMDMKRDLDGIGHSKIIIYVPNNSRLKE